MFYNVVLDVFIGLIFVFLLYSLLATILQEFIARWLGLRARMLQKALRRMLMDDAIDITEGKIDKIKKEATDLIKRFQNPIEKGTLLEKFYSHPTIKYLGKDKVFSKPSYLHAHNFSQTIVQILRGEEYDGRTKNESELIWNNLQKIKIENKDRLTGLEINDETLKNLMNLFADARQDSFLFKNKLEDWFEETMERASGWYRKQTQTILLIIGFVLAVSFNVDSIAISKILMKDKKAREQMVELAVSKQQQYSAINDSLRKINVAKTEIKNGDTLTYTYDSIPPVSDKFLESTYNELDKSSTEVLGILGLRGIAKKSDTSACLLAVSEYDSLLKKTNDPALQKSLSNAKQKALVNCLSQNKSGSPYQKSWVLIFIGWLLTALAISLGAPFWFDMLNKIVNLRESGKKPANTALEDKPGRTVTSGNPIKGADGKPING